MILCITVKVDAVCMAKKGAICFCLGNSNGARIWRMRWVRGRETREAGYVYE